MLDNRKAGDIPEINGKLVKVSLSSLDSVIDKQEIAYFMDFFFFSAVTTYLVRICGRVMFTNKNMDISIQCALVFTEDLSIYAKLKIVVCRFCIQCLLSHHIVHFK